MLAFPPSDLPLESLVSSQPVFLRLAFGGALVCFVLLEMVRLHRIPPLAAPVDTFLHRFTDARDSGPLVVRSAPLQISLKTYCQTLSVRGHGPKHRELSLGAIQTGEFIRYAVFLRLSFRHLGKLC